MRTPHSQSGFTLIEMIVSLGVFAVVVTITTGALLTVIASNQRFQNEQSVMTNLSFALDSMTREIRTGTHYYCEWATSTTNDIFRGAHHEAKGTDRKNCLDGHNGSSIIGVSFIEGGQSITGLTGSTRILYFYDSSMQKLYRRVGNNPPESIVSDDVIIDFANFHVSNVSPLLGINSERRQPAVTIFVQAYARNDTSVTPKRFRFQTTLTQRAFDI